MDIFIKLLSTLEELRLKCPWDKKQTMDSLRTMTIEEVYELSQAILNKDKEEICEELGDVLLHILFYSQIAKEKNWFTVIDVMEKLHQKLIKRHPYIYKEEMKNTYLTEKKVKKKWEEIKKEGKESIFSGLPINLPTLITSQKIQQVAHNIGFDWQESEQVIDKIKEELEEFISIQELKKEKKTALLEEEMGDILFSLINYSRFIGINADDALEKSNKKFIYRMQFIEKNLKKKGKTFDGLSMKDMDELWELSKKSEKSRIHK